MKMVNKKVYLKRKREILHRVITNLQRDLARVNRELKQLEEVEKHGNNA